MLYVYERSCREQSGRPARKTRYLLYPEGKRVQKLHLGGKDERRVNAKSLLGVLSLGIVKGTAINLIADGADEKEAVEALVELISSNFSE